MIRKLVRMAVCVVFLVACTEEVSTSSGRFGQDVSRGQAVFPNNGGNRGEQSARSSISRGTDQFIDRSALAAQSESKVVIEVVDNKSVEVRLVNASIKAAAQAILGDTLGLQFSVSSEVSGTVTIQSTGAIPKSVLVELFEAALEANNARIERKGRIYSIVPGSSGNRTFRMARAGGADSSTIVVAPLQFISAKQMLGMLAPLIDEGLNVVSDSKRNLLLMTGQRGQLEAAVDALNLFDVDVLKGKSIALVRLEAADPEDVVVELRTIFEASEGGMLEGVIEFVPNDRLSSVLVITSRSTYLARAQKWIRELDNTASNSQRYTKIYQLQNRSAEEIAPILDQFMGDNGDSGSSNESGASASATARSRVASDTERNALVVRALRAEHEEIRRLLVDLDRRGRQVALEATIAEVTLKNEVSLGVRWFFESGAAKVTFSDASNGGITSNFPGFSSVFSFGNADAVLNALAGVTDVEVISSPTLVVLDNKEAILQIGDQVPIARQTSVGTSDSNAPVVTSIEYRDTGVILKVKPQIGSSGSLVLEISQEVSSVSSTNTSGIDSPTISQRQISTTVVLQDGATLVLGGLIQESDNEIVKKIPGLGDVPVLGALFRTKSIEKGRTELLILIRPRIIESADDAAMVTSNWRRRFSRVDSILQTGLGDPTHTVRDLFN